MTLGVCVTGYDWECETRMVYGIYERCRTLDINLLVFSNLLRKPDLNSGNSLPADVMRGETEIFKLINYDLLDGLILFGDSLPDEKTLVEIVNKAKEHGVPAVNINDDNHDICRNVILSDRFAMETVVEHLVTDHRLTRINFISGFKGNLQSEERLAAYKKVLRAHGIPVEEKRIGYGEFWKKAYGCTESFLAEKEPPQAIVCANDAMAIYCIDCIKAHGLRVPEDILVTGFDATKDGELYSPSVTTARRAFKESGAAAVDMIVDIKNGKSVPHNVYADAVLVKKRSCGCVEAGSDGEKKGAYYDVRYGELHKFRGFNEYILDVTSCYASARTSAELFSSLKEGAEFFGLKGLYACICAEVERSAGYKDADTVCRGVSETMVCMYDHRGKVRPGTDFPSSRLVPENILDGETAVFYAFSPLHFADRFLGYLAYEPTRLNGIGNLFATWAVNISNNAGSFYINAELKRAAAELADLYMRDPLTGLYNRRGMDRMGAEFVKKAKKDRKRLTVMCADADGLKQINDGYGHEAGDVAITNIARAIASAVPEGSVCSRTGGDEYCAIIMHGDEFDVSACIERIDARLERFNSSSGLPYRVACSCGHSSACPSEPFSLEELINSADKDMYKIKAAKKTVRKD